jgi:crotonobetainyl-CoA:carnitine CoA-transferase CaiB-like acyl-CoA transferase
MSDTGPPTQSRPLTDLVVVDCTTAIAGPYCTKLFVDAGAEVTKVEPREGDPLRRHAATTTVPEGEDGVLFRYLHAGKRSMTIADGEHDRLATLLAGADLVVDDGSVVELDLEALRTWRPDLVVVSITPYGRTGPLAGAPASDLTLQAESGAILFKGDPMRPPVQAGGRITEFLGGLFAAPGALAAVQHARATGRGRTIDVSLHDVMAIAGSNYMHVLHDLMGRPPIVTPCRMVDTPGIEQATDGMVGFNTNAGHMFQLFLLLVERPDLMDDPTYASLRSRLAMGGAWQQVIDDWVGPRTVREILDAAGALRVPVAPVHDGATVITDEHLCARRVFVTTPDGLRHPRPPYRIDGTTMGVSAPSPLLGEHDDAPMPARRPAAESGPSQGAMPLAGCTVLDLTSWWVGALATQTLGFLGAEVIHVEGVAHPDGMRLTGAALGTDGPWWERGHMFAAANANKRGITLDLGTESGRDLLWRLIDRADVLVENFSPRVAESWGLTREAVLARNPRIVYQRMPAYGLDGPWRDRPAFAQTIEPMSTMASITGHQDTPPLSKGGLPDPVSGVHGAWAALVGLAEAKRTGRGVFVEAVMVEAALNVTAQPMLEQTAYGVTMQRTGNRSPHAAPQGVYAGPGPEQWLAISVTDDAQWPALVEVVDDETLRDPALATMAARRARHDDLDAVLARWAAARHPDAAAARLRDAGVPASSCAEPRTLPSHPQLRARGLFTAVSHPVLGAYDTPGLPYRFDGVETWVRTAAPAFGEHNRSVLSDLLGLSDAQIDDLEAAGVIAARPRGL